MTEKNKTAQTIVLKDGRKLGYAEYGDFNGKPVFFFHGWVGSRLEGGIVDEQSKKVGIRLIAPDRPGIGLSDIKIGRTFLDWSDDVLELADAIGIERFAVLGISGGIGAASGEMKPEDIDKVTSLLGVAFDTTLISLILSIIIMYLIHRLQEQDESLLTKIEQYVLNNFINRIYTKK